MLSHYPIEMICMRLTQEYQLIELYDEQASKVKLDAYIAFINKDQSPTNNNTKTISSPIAETTTSSLATVSSASTTTASATTSFLQRYRFNRMQNDATTTPTTSTTVTDIESAKASFLSSLTSSSNLIEKHKNLFVLSMGHRIQFLQFYPTGVS